MRTRVHHDESASRRARWIVLRAEPDGTTDAFGLGAGRWDRWIAVAHFGTERDARNFERGFRLGSNHAPAAAPLQSESETLRLLKLARDDYRNECQSLRARLRESVRQRVAA